MAPASAQWATEVDRLMKTEVNQLKSYEKLVAEYEVEGKTDGAEKIRKLAAKLRELFDERNPEWEKEIKAKKP